MVSMNSQRLWPLIYDISFTTTAASLCLNSPIPSTYIIIYTSFVYLIYSLIQVSYVLLCIMCIIISYNTICISSVHHIISPSQLVKSRHAATTTSQESRCAPHCCPGSQTWKRSSVAQLAQHQMRSEMTRWIKNASYFCLNQLCTYII